MGTARVPAVRIVLSFLFSFFLISGLASASTPVISNVQPAGTIYTEAATISADYTDMGTTNRVSVTSAGAQGNLASGPAAISSDGRYVAFASNASNLVSGDTNGVSDIFVRDTQAGTTTRVSTTDLGGQADGTSLAPAISADGRYVAFVSDATNLVLLDLNGQRDAFVKDTLLGTVVRSSTSVLGLAGNGATSAVSISSTGRYVAMTSAATNLAGSDTNGVTDIYVKDTLLGDLGTISRVSTDSAGAQANGASNHPSISGDGRYVALESDATNLAGSDTNGVRDVFMKDTQVGTTTRVSTDAAGAQANGQSDTPSTEGRYVAFRSSATNLVSGDSNGAGDIFLKDTSGGAIIRISLDSAGAQANGASSSPAISSDGRYVAFDSAASNLVTGDGNGVSDAFLRDTLTDVTRRVSIDSVGTQGGAASTLPAVSTSGRFTAFSSDATNLVAADSNAVTDVFVKDAGPGINVSSVSVTLDGNTISGCTATGIGVSCNVTGLTYGAHTIGGSVSDNEANSAAISGSFFMADIHAPSVSGNLPAVTVVDSTPVISADFADPDAGINYLSVILRVDGVDVTSSAIVTTGHIAYTPVTPLADGSHAVHLEVTDVAGNTATSDWSVSVGHQASYFTWYDNLYARNWVLMANPLGATEDAWFDLYIAGGQRYLDPLPGMSSGQVPAGSAVTPRYTGLIGGPVVVNYHSTSKTVISQRTIWAENSFEEVLGFDQARLSDVFYWPWYDMLSATFKNWIIVANNNGYPVYYEITIAGSLKGSGTIAPGQYVYPTFPGVMGGPVIVQAWTNAGKSAPANVMASQRVLINNDTAFNEVPGIPASELSSYYQWTWYDMQSIGSRNWVLVANPGAFPVYYEIRIAGNLKQSGLLAAGDNVTPMFPSVIGGPVEVQAWTDASKAGPATVLASQRTLWGPSFEEVPGYPASTLAPDYHWTWYDEQSPGMLNWVLVTNPNAFSVYYEVKVGGVTRVSNNIAPGGFETPRLPGVMGGPVGVQAWTDSGKTTPADVMASQRVLYNGFFNETLGTVLT